MSADVPGALFAVIGLGSLVYALTTGSTSGWTSPQVLSQESIGVFALVALVPAERRARAPMLRVSLFTSRQFDAINVTTLLLYGAFGAASYLLILRMPSCSSAIQRRRRARRSSRNRSSSSPLLRSAALSSPASGPAG